ncbi:unnamed protein product [Linum trigynum]|uniref:Epidermal patterning factor-like protein n=1 Tax=Linum trigynum TaxID=586398 RepID=A0AAV2CRK9_9ROSI
MASRNSQLIRAMAVLVLATTFLAMAPSFCVGSGGRLLESGGGSSPPNCDGKCNGCTPCVAVPSVHGGPPHSGGPPPPPPAVAAATGYNPREATPYKPIIWVCKCQPKVIA